MDGQNGKKWSTCLATRKVKGTKKKERKKKKKGKGTYRGWVATLTTRHILTVLPSMYV